MTHSKVLSLSGTIPNKRISMLQSGQRSKGSMGGFESVWLFANGRMLAMVCGLSLLVALHFDFVFGIVSNCGAGVGLGRSPQTLRNLFADFLKHYAPSQRWRGESATGLSVTDA